MADDFDSIESIDDITRILKIAESSGAEVHCQFSESGSATIDVELDIRGVSGTNVVLGIKRKPGGSPKLLSSVFKHGIKTGSPIEVVFSLVDGQYAIRDIVQDVSLATFTLSAGQNLLRLQRRKDFRVSVKTDGLTFTTRLPTASQASELSLIDLSAGGLRLLWPPTAGEIPATGTVLPGDLQLSSRHPAVGKPVEAARSGTPAAEKVVTVELKLVKNHGPDAPLKPDLGNALSFQFQNLGQEAARAVLFTCLFIHRNSYGSG